jgi:hypothetical protein
MDSQTTEILSHLKQHKTITAIEALKLYGCFRLAARIYDLAQAGNEIDCKIVKISGRGGAKRIAEYSLRKAAN